MTLKILLTTSLAFSVLAFGSAELWAIAITQILILWTACIWLISHIVSSEKSISRHSEPKAKNLVFAILVFILLCTIRLPYSFYPYGAKIRLIQVVSLLILFFVVTHTYSSKVVIPECLNRELQQLVTTLVCIGFVVSLLAVLQKLSGTKELLWFRELFSQRVISSFYGPFINRNTCAAYTGLIIPLAISAVMIQTDSSRKIFYSFILATILASQLFSLSRGGIASSLAAIILFTVFSFRITKSRQAKISSLVCAGGLAVALAAWIGYDPIFNRLKSIGAVKAEASYYMRFAAWEDTVKIVQDHPWFGTGLGTFPEIFTRYQTAHKEFTFQHAHNDFLELLSETGIVGFIIVFTGFVVWFCQSWVKLWQRHDKTAKYIGLGGFTSIFSLVLHSLVDFPLQNYAVLVLLMYVLAMTTLAVNRHPHFPLSPSPLRGEGWGEGAPLPGSSFPHVVSGNPVPLARKIFAVVLLLAAFALTPYLARPGIGSAYFALARTVAGKDSNHSRAVLYLNRAIANDSNNAAYHFELAKRYLSLGLSGDIDKNAAFALAERSLRTAAILSPHNATYNQR